MEPKELYSTLDLTKPFVPIYVRYSYAWAEINARIQARQQVSINFTTVSWLILSVVVSVPNEYQQARQWLAFLLPFFSLTFAFWICHNDATIGLLSKFCAFCEQFPDEEYARKLPSWHDPSQGWITQALLYRNFSDWAFILTFVVTAIPGFIIGWKTLPNSQLAGIGLMIASLIGLAAVALVYLNTKRRDKILGKFNLSVTATGLKVEMTK